MDLTQLLHTAYYDTTLHLVITESAKVSGAALRCGYWLRRNMIVAVRQRFAKMTRADQLEL